MTNFPGGSWKINFPVFYNLATEDTFRSLEIFTLLSKGINFLPTQYVVFIKFLVLT